MLDYIFKYQQSATKFIKMIKKHKLVYKASSDVIDNSKIISIEEPVADDIWDKLDELYDKLEENERKRLEAESTDCLSATALYIELKNGGNTIASIDPELVNRILGVLTIQELNDFIHQIAKSVEDPDTTPICQRK